MEPECVNPHGLTQTQFTAEIHIFITWYKQMDLAFMTELTCINYIKA